MSQETIDNKHTSKQAKLIMYIAKINDSQLQNKTVVNWWTIYILLICIKKKIKCW